jgi:SAM-dependent methyltransferase
LSWRTAPVIVGSVPGPSVEGQEGGASTPVRSAEEALAVHRSQVDRVLQSGDPTAIKGLYIELGQLLEQAVGAADAPLLSFPETAPEVLRLLGTPAGLLLDAGCGPNPAIAVAMARGPEASVVAFDIGLGTVRLAREVARMAGVTLLGVVGDLEALPFRAGAFAGGVCDDTIEHLPHDRAGVSELARVLVLRGTMVLATPNGSRADVLFNRARDRLRGVRRPPAAYYAATSHLREYTWREFAQLIEPFFRIRARGQVGWSGNWRRRWASRAVRLPVLSRWSRMVVLAVEPRAGSRPG